VTSVLVVDDNDPNRKLALDVLRAAGLRTFGAATAAEAIALAQEHGPDVILMDLRLPDMDGADATRRLAGHERTAQIPVVAMTASPSRSVTAPAVRRTSSLRPSGGGR